MRMYTRIIFIHVHPYSHTQSPGELQFLLTNLVRDEETKQFKWRINLDTLLASLPDLAGVRLPKKR